jgi:endonuclease/exonuclease/phosphatase family metal-dependent hydrolase
MKVGKGLMTWFNILVSIATLLAYLAPNVTPKEFPYLAIFGVSFPVLIIFHFMFILFWLFVDIKKTVISILSLGIGYVFIRGVIAFNSPTDKVNSKTFSVVSYNISNARAAYDRSSEIKKIKKDQMLDFLKRFEDEDIICLQEVGDYASEMLKSDASFKKWNLHKLDKGAIILSKHNIIDKGEIPFGTKTNSCLWADLIINFDTIRVYSIHLQSNRISKDADAMIEKRKIEKETWVGVKGIVRKFNHFNSTRASQAELIKKHINTSPFPVVACGDFNDTPLSYTYAHLSEGLRDVFYERGRGIGTTYSGKIPFLRIDYILTSQCFSPMKFSIIKQNFSDHYPVAAQVSYECKKPASKEGRS